MFLWLVIIFGMTCQEEVGNSGYILGNIPKRQYPYVGSPEEIEQVCSELLVLHHLEDVRVCDADNPDIGMLGLKDMEQNRLLIEGQQLQVLKDDCSSIGIGEVTLYPVVGFATVRLWVVFPDVRCASGFNHDEGLLST